MKAKVLYCLEMKTKEGKSYYKVALLVATRFGFDLSVCSTNNNYADYVGTNDTVDVFYYKGKFCISDREAINPFEV